MKTTKRTYALPSETIRRFEEIVEPGRRSRMLARFIDEWLAERERRALREAIIEGCRDMSDEYLEIEREMRPLSEEALRVVGY